MKQILLPVGEIFLFPGSPGYNALIGTIILPDAQALRETDLDPSLDPWAEIERLKRQKNAVILAHYYQNEEIQDLADFGDDFLDLSPPARSVPQAAE